ncbi:mannitol dehydrogenase family protein [Oerskovia flava]|uniref:mannitol dehydrogenase family protein n=1 Tax=Oerskovia flava TaxID=2986422 RepID=UPI00223FCDDB|nr:mannitol dehydrogenase family protein [Oerskovia sp. JB1-3-2]
MTVPTSTTALQRTGSSTGSSTGPVQPPRLCRDALPGVVAEPVRPEQVGIVHLGIGAFHRAHQAVVTEDAALATGDLRWGILGVTQRSGAVRDQLRPQGGVYTVLTAGVDGVEPRLIGSVLDVAWPAQETARVLDVVAAPSTHVVTLTITEKGYSRSSDGTLDVDAVRADLDVLRAEEQAGPAGSGPPAASSAVGLLVRALAARRRAGGTPITVLSCDNLVDNGRVLAGLVRVAVDAALPGTEGDPLREWIAASVTFPGSMVDRIVPATTAAQRDEVEALLGARDEGLVVAEPYLQWVIEDRFAGPRPAWEQAGATLTADVRPYEQAKLRLLNGTHSLVAYAGALAGHTTIAEAVADPRIAAQARAFLFDDALPTLTPPDGTDLVAYGEQILERFANPHTGHTTVQVAMDGSQKIPYRWLGTVRDRRAAGVVPRAAAAAVASWMVFVARGRTVTGGPLPLDDPLASELRAAAGPAQGEDGSLDADRLVDALLGVRAVFGGALADDGPWVAAVRAEVGVLLEQL